MTRQQFEKWTKEQRRLRLLHAAVEPMNNLLHEFLESEWTPDYLNDFADEVRILTAKVKP